VTEEHVAQLEREIDRRETALPALRTFILPGGSPVGALLHLARTVCRRAERRIVTLAEKDGVDARVIVYVNRLSDLLFVLARQENRRARRPETAW
jgi:cob(I)alamin adenosyltransferase